MPATSVTESTNLHIFTKIKQLQLQQEFHLYSPTYSAGQQRFTRKTLRIKYNIKYRVYKEKLM